MPLSRERRFIKVATTCNIKGRPAMRTSKRQYQNVGQRRQPGVGVQKQQCVGTGKRSTGVHLHGPPARRCRHSVHPRGRKMRRAIGAPAVRQHDLDAARTQGLQRSQRGLDAASLVQGGHDNGQDGLHRASFSAQS
jgi:hypothetical protein